MGCRFCKQAPYRAERQDEADEVDAVVERQITIWDRGVESSSTTTQTAETSLEQHHAHDHSHVPAQTVDAGSKEVGVLAAPLAAPLVADVSDDEINTARQRILPNDDKAPEAVLSYMSDTGGRSRGELTEAVAWLVDALSNAHCHKSILDAARSLLVAGNFTVNLSVMGQWRGIQERVHAHLHTLGKPLQEDFDSQMLEGKLSDAVLEPLVARNPAFEGVSPDDVNQSMVIPLDSSQFDFSRQSLHLRHDKGVYLHVIMMVATAAESIFAAKVKQLANTVGIPVGESCQIPPRKAFTRAHNKADADYYLRSAPCSGYNVDVIRCLLAATTPKDIKRLLKECSTHFGDGTHPYTCVQLATCCKR